MGIRFRRSFKIAPGVRWNFGAKSTSFTFGPRGAKWTVGTRGTRTTVGIPGTGLSFTTTASGRRRATVHALPAATGVPSVAPARFNIPPQRMKFAVTTGAWIAAAVFLATMSGSALLLMLGGTLWSRALPSRHLLARRELDRRLQLFRQECQDATEGNDRQRIERLLALRQESGLTDDETAVERETIETSLALYALEDQIATSGLPVVPGYDDTLKGAPGHFAALAYFEKRGPDETAMLLLSSREAVFNGNLGQTRVPWAKVARVTSDGRDILIQRADRQTPYCFRMGSLRDAKAGAYIAAILHERMTQE
jgi:hypothetical protein